MNKMNLTENEMELLKYAYTDDDRIEEGLLFDYQVEALHMIRKCSVYLNVRYPMYNLTMVSFLPQDKKRNYTEIHFRNEGSLVTYTLRYKMGETDTFSDNFYDVPFEDVYDKRIEKELKKNGVEALAYTVFPFLISDKIEDLDALWNKKELGRNTEIFILCDSMPNESEMNASLNKITEVFKKLGFNTNGILYYLFDLEDKDMDNISLDSYVKDRENQKNYVSLVFRIM